LKRGEVWLVDFGDPTGPEQAGRRPGVVFQHDDLTAGLTTVLVIPLTTNLRRLDLECTALIAAGEAAWTETQSHCATRSKLEVSRDCMSGSAFCPRRRWQS